MCVLLKAHQRYDLNFTFAYSIKWSDEVLVAHDGEADERVDGDQHVDDEAAGASRLETDQRFGELLDGRRRAVDPVGADGGVLRERRLVRRHLGWMRRRGVRRGVRGRRRLVGRRRGQEEADAEGEAPRGSCSSLPHFEGLQHNNYMG